MLSLVLVAPALGTVASPAATALAAPATVALAPTAGATATSDGPITLDLAPAASPIVRPGQDLQVIATVANGGADAIDAGSIDVYLAGRALTTQSALETWLDADGSDSVSDLLVSTPLTSSIQPGNTATITITVPSAELGLTELNAWGARGIAAKLTDDSTATAEGRSTFVWYPTESVTPIDFSIVMPITTPAGSVGIIPATALETYTGPNGLLTRQLDGVIDTSVTLGIDPMIIASIRILGSEAPASALAWLDRLAHASNETFPLSYADADIALEAQTSGFLRGPLSFAQALDPAAFVTPPPAISPDSDSPSSAPQGLGARELGTRGPLPSSLLAESSASPTPTPTPSPTETTGEPTLPSTEELLAWSYSSTRIAWPAADSVSAADLPVFAASGLTITMLSESQVTRADSSMTPSPTVTIEGGVGIVAADGLSEAINRAVTATTDEDWHAGIAEAASQLAVAAANQSGSTQSIVAALDRGWPSTAMRLNQTIATLTSMPWTASVSLTQASSAAVASDATFKSKSEDDTRLELASRLNASELAVTDFSTAIADPLALTAPERLSQLALFATSWIDDQSAWVDAVGNNLTDAKGILDSVVVTTKGPINVFASQVDIPITLTNEFDQNVTVRLNLQPTNARLVVGDDVEETIEANSARTIRIPVSAKVGNGAVTLRATVYSPTGVQVGEPVLIEVNVQAEWEGVGAIIFAIAVILFFGFGVWRNISGRRKRRDKPADAADATTTGAGEPAKTVTTDAPSRADDSTTTKDTPVTDDSTTHSATDDTRE